MSNSIKVDLDDRYANFGKSTYTYKVIEGHEILVDVYIPKAILSVSGRKRQPLITRLHGGWLVGGQRTLWCPAWVLDFTLKHNAIFVAPDYRFVPEASAEEILEDMDSFWEWVGSKLPSIVKNAGNGVEVDLDNILVEGESAGGYLSIQLALGHFKDPNTCIRALISVYPMLDFYAPHWSQAYFKQVFDVPQYPASVIDEHIARIKQSTSRPIVTNDDMVSTGRNELALALIQHGRFLEVLGEERDPSPGQRRLMPEERLVDGAKLPPTLLVHGTEDSGVPVEGTDKFIDLLKQHDSIDGINSGREVLSYQRVPGEHGFDDAVQADEPWVLEAYQFVEKYWPVPVAAVPI